MCACVQCSDEWSVASLNALSHRERAGITRSPTAEECEAMHAYVASTLRLRPRVCIKCLLPCTPSGVSTANLARAVGLTIARLSEDATRARLFVFLWRLLGSPTAFTLGVSEEVCAGIKAACGGACGDSISLLPYFFIRYLFTLAVRSE